MSKVKYADAKKSKRGTNQTITTYKSSRAFSKRTSENQEKLEKTQQCLHGFQTTYTLFNDEKTLSFIMCFRRDYGTYYGQGM